MPPFLSRSEWFFSITTAVIIFVVTAFLFTGFTQPALAFDGIITYQGKLSDSSGTTVSDGDYSIKFSIYDAATGGNCKYTASGTCGTPTAVTVTVSGGIFSVNLGDGSDTNTIDPTIFQTNNLFLGVTVASDSEMTPRKQLNNVGFAYNALYLSGLATSTVGGTNSFIPASDSTGNFTYTGTPQDTTVSGGVLYINPGSATADYTLLGLAVGGTEKFRIDEDGDVFASGSLRVAGDILPGIFVEGVGSGTSIGSHTAAMQNIYASGTVYANNVTVLGTCTGCGGAWTDGGANTYLTDSSDNIGIGTTTPAGTLGVAGSLYIQDNSILGDTSSDTLTVNATTTYLAGVRFESDLHTLANVTFGDAATDQVRINGDLTVVDDITASSDLTVSGDLDVHSSQFAVLKSVGTIDNNDMIFISKSSLDYVPSLVIGNGTSDPIGNAYENMVVIMGVSGGQDLGGGQSQLIIQDTGGNDAGLHLGYDQDAGETSTGLAYISSNSIGDGLEDMLIEGAWIHLEAHANGNLSKAGADVNTSTAGIVLENANDKNLTPIVEFRQENIDRLYLYSTDTLEVLWKSTILDQDGASAHVFDTAANFTNQENRSLLMVRNAGEEQFSISGSGDTFTSGTMYTTNFNVSGTCTGCGANLNSSGGLITLDTSSDDLAFGTSTAVGKVTIVGDLGQPALSIHATSTSGHLTQWVDNASSSLLAWVDSGGGIHGSSTLNVTGVSNFFGDIQLFPNGEAPGDANPLMQIGTKIGTGDADSTLVIKRAQDVSRSEGQIAILDTAGNIMFIGVDDTGSDIGEGIGYVSTADFDMTIAGGWMRIEADHSTNDHVPGLAGGSTTSTPTITIADADLQQRLAPLIGYETIATDRLYLYVTDTTEVLWKSLVQDQADVRAFSFDTQANITTAENRSLLMVRNAGEEKFSINGAGDTYTSGTMYTNDLNISGTCTGCGGLGGSGTITLNDSSDDLAFGTSTAVGKVTIVGDLGQPVLSVHATSTSGHLTQWINNASTSPLAYIDNGGGVWGSSTLQVTGNTTVYGESHLYGNVFIDENAAEGVANNALLLLGSNTTNPIGGGDVSLFIKRAQDVNALEGQIVIQDGGANGKRLIIGYDDDGSDWESSGLALLTSYYSSPGSTKQDFEIRAARVEIDASSQEGKSTTNTSTPAITLTDDSGNATAPILALRHGTNYEAFIYASGTDVLLESFVPNADGSNAFVVNTHETLTAQQNRSLLSVRNDGTEQFSVDAGGTIYTSGSAHIGFDVDELSPLLFVDDSADRVSISSSSPSYGFTVGNDVTAYFGNTVTIGDSSADTVAINAAVSTDVLPSTHNTSDLGSATASWLDMYASGSVRTPTIWGTTSVSASTTAALYIRGTDNQTNGTDYPTLQVGEPSGSALFVFTSSTAQVALVSNVVDAAGANAFVFDTFNPISSSTDRALLSVHNGGARRFSVGGTGDVYAAGAFNASTDPDTGFPGDLAEYVHITPGEEVEAGDVIMLDPENPLNHKKSEGALQAQVAGIVSNTGAFIIGTADNGRRVPMALAGLVNIKATNESGPIEVGDLLVTATEPGHVMKYDPDIHKGVLTIVGMAMEPLEETSGKVLAHVRNGWINNSGSTSLSIGENTDGSLSSDTAETFTASIASTRGTWAIDENGTMKVKKITAEEYVVEQNDDAPTIGEGVIETGQSVLTIQTPAVQQDSKIFVSFLTNLAGRSYHISEKIPGDSFTIMLSSQASEFTYLDWWIVQKDGDTEELEAEEAPPVPIDSIADEPTPAEIVEEEPIPTFEEFETVDEQQEPEPTEAVEELVEITTPDEEVAEVIEETGQEVVEEALQPTPEEETDAQVVEVPTTEEVIIPGVTLLEDVEVEDTPLQEAQQQEEIIEEPAEEETVVESEPETVAVAEETNS